MKSFKSNKRAVSTAISSIIMIGATIACMTAATVYCQCEINAYHSMLGENLCIERVKIAPTSIWAYVRNNGHGAITLQFVRVNGKAYNFTAGKVLLDEGGGKNVTIQGGFGSGAYLLEFVSARWKVFSVEVKCP